MAENSTLTTGWKSSPDGRGTLDILASCILTIALCCWTSVCPNLPSLTEGSWAQFRDKFDLACIGMLGPEFLLGIAVGQRTSARRSVKKFKEGGYKGWTLSHAFWADMGGFVMEVEGLERPVPLNAEQLFWLVERGYVEMPALSRDEIRDKNKSDGLARLLTIGQTLWFIASSVTRVGQGLSITTLELTTVSFIIVLFGTSYCWLHKPSDVLRPVIIKCNSTISIIRNEAGYHDPEDYTTTPLDFINREDYVMDMIWKYYVGILYKMRIPLFSRPIKARPYNRNCNTDFLKTELDFELFAGVFIFAFSATTMCAWNFYFPTPVERLLWRCASAFTLIFGVVGGLYMWLWHLVLLDKHKAKQLPTSEASSMVSDQPKGAHNGVKSLFMKVRNLSTYEEPTSRLPLGVLAPVTAFCVLYCLSRAYILIEDVVSLRSLPASVYATVEWSQYIPHF